MIIKRICEKYPIDYTLIPDFRMSKVCLRFTEVSEEIQEQLQDKLIRLGILQEDVGIAMEFSLVDRESEKYVLRLSGKDMFYYAPRFETRQYDMSEAVAWSIYVLAGHKDWLNSYQGRYLYCRCFSSRQQAAAARISSSVARQYQSTVPQELVQQVFDKLKGSVDGLVRMAPRFSGQPMEYGVYSQANGRTMTGSLEEIARKLFGERDFEAELNAYVQLIRDSSGYQKVLADAVDALTEAACELPIMAVSGFFTALGTLIDEIVPVEPATIQKLLQKTGKLTVNAQNLKNAFAEVDEGYLKKLGFQVETEFLRTACDNAYDRIKKECADARQNIMQLYGALGRFCFVRPDSFAQEDQTMLTWKQLSCLEERHIYSKNVNWDEKSLHDLQSVMNSTFSPYLWICSQPLANRGKNAAITAAAITYPAPVMDDKLVWAIWVENH